MIATTDVANILYKDSKRLGLQVLQEGNVKESSGERVIVHAKSFTPGRIWNKSFAEANIFVPDLPGGTANLVRLNELERLAMRIYEASGTYDGTLYRYNVYSVQLLSDDDSKSRYLNVKISFSVLNTKS